MSKPKAKRRLNDNEARAMTRLLRVSPQKLNLLAQMIRGQKANKAIADLTFSRKRIAGQVLKTLISAVSNAENNHSLDIDNLIVAEAYVGRGFVMRRFHARGRGRAASIERPFSHLTIVVRQVEGEEKKTKPKKTSGKAKSAETTKKRAA